MKNFKKLGIGLAALVLAFGLVFGMSAFKSKAKTGKKKTTIFWRYDSNNMIDIRNENEYSIVGNPGEGGCDAGTELPCVLELDADIDSPSELHDYLNDVVLFPNDEDITASTTYKKYAE